MRVVSAFSGIEGLGLGLEQAGMEVAAQVEIDQACRDNVLARHYPGVPRWTDITEVNPDDLPAADLVCGGFPCQDLSVAGRRQGLAGARSSLWWQFWRILAATHPRWVVVENVPGLLSAVCPDPDAPEPRPSREYADADFELTIADPDEPGDQGPGACAGGCMAAHGGAMGLVLGSLAELGYGFAYRVLDAQHFGLAQRRRRVFIVGCLGDWAAPVQVLLEPEGGQGHPAPRRTAGQGVAASLTAGVAATRGVNALQAAGNQADAGIITHALTAEGADASEDGTGRGTPLVVTPVRAAGAGTANGLGVYRAGDPAPTLDTTGDAAIAFTKHQRAHHPDDDETWGETEVAGTLDAGGHTPRTATAVAAASAVRRLTPTECERLQGFPDGWTAGQPDSTRYRQLGNAVAVPVAAWIGRRILQVEAGR